MNTPDVARKQLDTLHQEGNALAEALAKDVEEKEVPSFAAAYQRWYSRALPLIEEWAPDRYAEFQRYYRRDPKIQLHWYHDRVIQDYLCEQGKEDAVTSQQQALSAFTMQLTILKSIADRLEWMAPDTEDQAARGLQLEELEAARELIGIDERAAGALAGAVLEVYLRKLAAKREVKLRKQKPLTAELVEALKQAKVFDVPVWSQAAWLAEIHGRCLKEGEGPTKLQVRDLVDGTRWLVANVF